MKRLLSALAIFVLLGGAAHAQRPDFGPPVAGPAIAGFDGRWEGAIATPEGALPGVFRISTAGDRTTTLMDSPSQGALSIPALTKRDGKSIVIDLPIVGGNFTGELSADGATIAGAWHQSGMDLPLVLTRK